MSNKINDIIIIGLIVSSITRVLEKLIIYMLSYNIRDEEEKN
jgi:hypothetical protein